MPLTSTELALTARRLQGRTALVKGAATGIGAATARALAVAGATVAHLDQARDTLHAVRRTGSTVSRSAPTSPSRTPSP